MRRTPPSQPAPVDLTGLAPPPEATLSLWYRKPATRFEEALPLGNGRLGAMVFGGVDKERIGLNEDTLWAGGPYDPANPDAPEALPQVRNSSSPGKYAQAQGLVSAKIMGKPPKQMPYQTVGRSASGPCPAGAPPATTAGNWTWPPPSPASATRATACVTRAKMFSAPVDQVIVVRLSADQPGQGQLLRLHAVADAGRGDHRGRRRHAGAAPAATATREASPGSSSSRRASALFNAGGTLRATATPASSSLTPTRRCCSSPSPRATRSYDDVSGDPAAPLTALPCRRSKKRPYDAMRAAHIAEHQRIFRRVDARPGHQPTPSNCRPTSGLPGSATSDDPELAALYFQYGRYLLISSHPGPGGQPANLQGLWNESMTPPWGSKYTININTEMNYWPAEPANLPECDEPLLRDGRGPGPDRRADGARPCTARGGWVVPPQHRSVARHGAHRRRATTACGRPAAPGSASTCGTTTSSIATATSCARAYPLMKGAASSSSTRWWRSRRTSGW